MAAPTVTTAAATDIAATSATLGGTATETTNSIIERGVVYDTSSGPALSDVVELSEAGNVNLSEAQALEEPEAV